MVKVLPHASAKKKTQSLKGFKFHTFSGRFFKWHHGCEVVKPHIIIIFCYRQRLLLRRKMDTCVDRHQPAYLSRPQIIQENFNSRFKTPHKKHRRRRGDRKISNGKRPMGHWRLLQSKWSSTELWTWNWHGCCHAVSNQFRVFDITRVVLSGKQGSFPIYK